MTTTSQTTDQTNQSNLQDLTMEEQQSFAEEMGTLVFQSALMQFLAEADDEVAVNFEDFVEKNVVAENFIDDLCSAYPDFEQILKDEMILLQAEVKEIITDEEGSSSS